MICSAVIILYYLQVCFFIPYTTGWPGGLLKKALTWESDDTFSVPNSVMDLLWDLGLDRTLATNFSVETVKSKAHHVVVF